MQGPRNCSVGTTNTQNHVQQTEETFWFCVTSPQEKKEKKNPKETFERLC